MRYQRFLNTNCTKVRKNQVKPLNMRNFHKISKNEGKFKTLNKGKNKTLTEKKNINH